MKKELLTTITLRGRLRALYGDSFLLHVNTPREAIKALSSQLKGFFYELSSGKYRLLLKREKVERNLEKGLENFPLRGSEIIIVPELLGSGGSLDFINPFPAISNFLTDTFISPTFEKVNPFANNPVAQRPSFLFNGSTNTSEQGSPVPLVYGQMRTGSVLISVGVQTENI